MDFFSLFTAFSIGLLGGAHCIGMCGGVIGALTMAIDANRQYSHRLRLILTYNIGRIASYIVIALLFFFLANTIQHYFSLSFMRILAACLLIAMGFYLADWWRGLKYLEKLGGYLWRYLQPLARPLMPVKTSWQAILLGGIWGWLPCGLIYSALAYSATADNAFYAALTMLSFALGTLPAVMVSGLFAERLSAFIQAKMIRVSMGVLIILFGLWTLWSSLSHLGHA